MIKVMGNTGKVHYSTGVRHDGTYRTLCGKIGRIHSYDNAPWWETTCLTCIRTHKERNV